MGIIFDLDQTLIDSTGSAEMRQARRWSQVYSAIPRCPPYPGIQKVLDALEAQHVPCAVVTNAPASYCERVMAHWGWELDAVVCWHDTSRHKPDPDPFHLAASRLGVPAQALIALGDAPDDITAATRANMLGVAALWGASDPEATMRARPTAACNTPQSFLTYLRGRGILA